MTATGVSEPQARTLSRREVEVLAYAAEGMSNREIGDALGLSGLTIKSHFARIGSKLGVTRRETMVLIGILSGQVHLTVGPAHHVTITARERQILRLIPDHPSSAGLAATLFISEDTVRTYLQRLFKKYGVHSRAELLAYAIRDRIITLPDLGSADLRAALLAGPFASTHGCETAGHLPDGTVITIPSRAAVDYLSAIAHGMSPDSARRRHIDRGSTLEPIEHELRRHLGTPSLVRQCAIMYFSGYVPGITSPQRHPSRTSLGIMTALVRETDPLVLLRTHGMEPADIDRHMLAAGRDMGVSYVHYATLVVHAMAAGWISPLSPVVPRPRPTTLA